MSFDIAISVLLLFSAASYFALGTRLVAAKREVGTMPIGLLFLVISIWVAGGGIELLSTTFFFVFYRPYDALRGHGVASCCSVLLFS